MTTVPVNSPVVGILCIDISVKLRTVYGHEWTNYISASYVKYLESAGALVVPIWIGRDRDYYEYIMSHINGILMPGGAVFLNSNDIENPVEQPNDCVESARIILELAIEFNNKGHVFPIWGTCLGFQLLLSHSANRVDLRQDCTRMDCLLPLIFAQDYKSSKLFEHLSSELKTAMESEPICYHFHRFCITKPNLINCNIKQDNQDWHILATNRDANGLEFITMIEHNKYPFFGCQFHPERNSFEHVPESIQAISGRNCAQYLANFFVDRFNNNHFTTYEELLRHLIYNFNISYTASKGIRWLQCYLFQKDTEYPNLANYTEHADRTESVED